MADNTENSQNIDIISPISLGNNIDDPQTVIDSILWQHEHYGIDKFMVSAPMKGWRSVGYPPPEHYDACAVAIKKIKEACAPHGVKVGWWIILSIKSGNFSESSATVNVSGQKHAFANCPLCESFADSFTKDIARVADIAKPDFLITEDDFSLEAAKGCFCHRHLDGFAKEMGRYYSREELSEAFARKNEDDTQLFKAWKAFSAKTLVDLAHRIRREVDKKSPEMPIGFMQPGGADIDGNCTEAMARALAGKNHTPFARLFGTFYYYGYNSKGIPETVYHPVYSKQHISGDFKYYHESDTFPSTGFYTSGAQMRALMSAVYSYGFDGSTFQTAQSLDDPTEERAYGTMLSRERKRFDKVHAIAKKCENTGVLICFDPFYNNFDRRLSKKTPLWAEPIGRFGIPYVTSSSRVAFLDERQTKYFDDKTLTDLLSKAVILDGDAAFALCQRGFGKYLGVDVGCDVITGTPLANDLSTREVVTDEFATLGKGITMPAANAYSPIGNGKALKLTKTSKSCKTVTKLCKMGGEEVCPAMTYFENELGGKAVVMGMTLDQNRSQSLYNYRRMRLIQHLVGLCCEDFAMVKDEHDVFVIQNDSKENGGLLGMLTVINLGEDALDSLEIRLPKKWLGASVSYLDKDAQWQSLDTENTTDGILARICANYLDPVYLRFKIGV